MIGSRVTLVRVKPQQRSGREVFTTKGVIMDMTEDAEGSVTGIRIQGVRVETMTLRDSWFAVGPNALDGSMCTEQTATLDDCGCPVTDMCGCTCTPRVSLGCEADDCVIKGEPRVVSPYGADTLRFTLD
jgi:hypothetical protein